MAVLSSVVIFVKCLKMICFNYVIFGAGLILALSYGKSSFLIFVVYLFTEVIRK